MPKKDHEGDKFDKLDKKGDELGKKDHGDGKKGGQFKNLIPIIFFGDAFYNAL